MLLQISSPSTSSRRTRASLRGSAHEKLLKESHCDLRSACIVQNNQGDATQLAFAAIRPPLFTEPMGWMRSYRLVRAEFKSHCSGKELKAVSDRPVLSSSQASRATWHACSQCAGKLRRGIFSKIQVSFLLFLLVVLPARSSTPSVSLLSTLTFFMFQQQRRGPFSALEPCHLLVPSITPRSPVSLQLILSHACSSTPLDSPAPARLVHQPSNLQ